MGEDITRGVGRNHRGPGIVVFGLIMAQRFGQWSALRARDFAYGDLVRQVLHVVDKRLRNPDRLPC